MTLARDGELTESLVVMMSESVDLNCVDSYGWTPLYEAIHQGHLDVVTLLVMEGADVDHVDMAGWSPLYLAAYYGHLEIVKFLAVQVTIYLFDEPFVQIYMSIPANQRILSDPYFTLLHPASSSWPYRDQMSS